MIVSKIKEILATHKKRDQLKREAELQTRIYIKEAGGKLWILCDGIAIKEVATTTTAQEVNADIEEIRRCVTNYSRL